MEITTVDRALIADAIYGAGLEDNALYEGYSGRGMYGAECFGITVDQPGDYSRFLVELAQEAAELAGDLASCERSDSMGLGIIYYFPGRTVAPEVDWDDALTTND